jgi:hypothetical protein
MCLDHSKDMSVHVNLHQLKFQHINASFMEVVLIRHVFLHLVAKMSDWFLEQQINIKLCEIRK